jgi:hypothetical protein
VKAQIGRSEEMCVQFGVIISLLVMICDLYVGQVIMIVQRDPSESEI